MLNHKLEDTPLLDGLVNIKRALISVSNKSGLEDLLAILQKYGVEIISTGGTGKFIKEQGIEYTNIEDVTGNPEAFKGRMKTISFEIGSSLLFQREDEDDILQAKELGIKPIDLVICNLYPFQDVVNSGSDWLDQVENIDIGGPTMVRAAAKNYKSVAVVTNPNQYYEIINCLEENSGSMDLSMREKLSLSAFRHTAEYDCAIANRMEQRFLKDGAITPVISPATAKELRYGENPHQKAWVYKDPFDKGLASIVPIQGKELSYNNLLDADAAWRVNGDVSLACKDKAVVSIIKHLNPCGIASSNDVLTSLKQAWDGDKVSAFGSIICFNQELSLECAKWLDDKFVEVILAPSFTKEALELFATKKNLRLLEINPHNGEYSSPVIRSISGGFVMQDEDAGLDTEFKVVTKKQFKDEIMELSNFAIMASKHLKSNAIGLFINEDGVYKMIGAGMGNPNRLISIEQAVGKANENGYQDLSNAVLISDAFFPFADNIDLIQPTGIKYIIQPGGSIKDKSVIKACDEQEIAMLFTGRRHFRH